MRCSLRFFAIVLTTAVYSMVWYGCVNEEQGSLFDPDATFAPAPSITSITPSGGSQAGVDTLTITGTNFSATLGLNIAYFNSTTAALLQASPTQLLLKAPFVLGDSVRVRTAVYGSDQLSNLIYYKLTAAIAGFGSLLPGQFGKAIATDASGNLFVSMSSNTGDIGIRRITSAGDTMTFAPPTPLIAEWSSLKMGPGGNLYVARNARAVFRIPPGGGSAPSIWVSSQIFPSSARIVDFDFDANQYLWAGGNNANVYCIKQDQTVKTYPFLANVRSFRVFNGYLYMSAFKDSAEGIWRAPIIFDSIGVAEKYFDFATAFPGKPVQGITFSAAGNLYIATTAPEGLVIVTPSKTYSAPYSAYKDLFGTGLKSLAWGSGDALYAISINGTLSKVNTRTTGAPYYGQ
ncbi:MAG TPA: IPT/TIG domain-containing protein [Bacteroidota bacterium]|nr:IPT/TIG domain-containing protein [Bacteroidota bacterium]